MKQIRFLISGGGTGGHIYPAISIANELSSSIVINGDALDEDILKEANIEESETVLALTNDDENNINLDRLGASSWQKRKAEAKKKNKRCSKKIN